ncbi:SGNH/GDSL hydrolase family protein [Streptomyces hokutonensis]|uniref:SGNH/GDSL hydrolase family protein n=1 Tax=Streptomyces hokutonensis TaxID=1306990 RepID=A0ABW6M5D6_9ACTN
MRSVRGPVTRRTAVVVLALSLAVAGLAATALVSAPGHRGGRSWFTSWAQSQQDLAGTRLHDQSVRMITHLSQGGDALRVRVQNTFGTTPLAIGAATVGHSGHGAAITGLVRAVTFGGHRDVVIPPGGEVWSDAAGLASRPQDDIAVSLSVADTATPGEHSTGLRTNYLSPAGSGDHTAEADGDAYTQTIQSTYLVSAVDVRNAALKGTIVTYGSSVVDGVGSTNCGPGCTETGANRRWPDDLARRINSEIPANRQLAVANAGISGTTSSAACPHIPDSAVGLDAAARLQRDVLALHGVTGVIYYYGTNDLADDCNAAQILASYRAVFQRLHSAGIKVYVTPITPRPGYTDRNNLDRFTVGSWVKKWNTCSGTCDGVPDFDQVLKDPLKPNSINPAYDNGDGIHANIAGQQAVADVISLLMLGSLTAH